MSPQPLVKPVDMGRVQRALATNQLDTLTTGEIQQAIDLLREQLHARTTTTAAKPRVQAHMLVKIQHLRATGFDVDAMVRDLRRQGADPAAVIAILEGCADGAW